MRVWCAACYRGGGGDGGSQCGLKPGLGLTVLLAVVGVVAVADVTFATFGVFTKNIERNVATLSHVLALTWNVALFTAGLFTTAPRSVVVLAFTRNVTLFTAGLFTPRDATFGAVGRRVSGLGAVSAGLIQECGAHDFSVGAGLVFHVVAGVFGDCTARIIADLTVGSTVRRLGGGSGGGLGCIGGISGVRRHLISVVVAGMVTIVGLI